MKLEPATHLIACSNVFPIPNYSSTFPTSHTSLPHSFRSIASYPHAAPPTTATFPIPKHQRHVPFIRNFPPEGRWKKEDPKLVPESRERAQRARLCTSESCRARRSTSASKDIPLRYIFHGITRSDVEISIRRAHQAPLGT